MGNVNVTGSRGGRQSSRDRTASYGAGGGGGGGGGSSGDPSRGPGGLGGSPRAGEGGARKSDAPREALGAWDVSAVSSLIAEGKLSGQKVGREDCGRSGTECPICFLYYDSINGADCCKQPICTSCYLQVRPQRQAVPCPFCSREGFSAELRDFSADAKEGKGGAGFDEIYDLEARAEAKEERKDDGNYYGDKGGRDDDRPGAKAGAPSPSDLDVAAKFGDADAKRGVPEALAMSPQAKDAKQGGAPTPTASVEERLRLEEQMRAQLTLARERGDSIEVVETPIPRSLFGPAPSLPHAARRPPCRRRLPALSEGA